MSKRKKTPTSKNTQPKLTKVQLTKKINAMDLIEIAKVAGQTGIIGAAFRINYHEVNGTLNRVEALCSKCIQKTKKIIEDVSRYNIETEEQKDELSNAVAELTHAIYNHELPKSMKDIDLYKASDVLFNILLAYVFQTDVIKKYCADNEEGRVGILVTYNIKYYLETDEYQTNLSIKAKDNFEEWMIASTELIADGKGSILTK